ncbi:hypothetical protein O1L60_21985 [Streptomyces diastatochromogenes]|nr:hypothetical protein [Streptomyces diastatochromogenes]
MTASIAPGIASDPRRPLSSSSSYSCRPTSTVPRRPGEDSKA